MLEVSGTYIVILDRIAWPDHLDVLKASNGSEKLKLGLGRETVIKAIGVNNIASDSFGFQPYLM